MWTAFVITHGTDTMEETTSNLALALDSPVHVVLTGAQLRADDVGYDGYRNLKTADRTATAPGFRGAGGVFIDFEDLIHAARDVTKADTTALSALASQNVSPIARVTADGFECYRDPGTQTISMSVIKPTGRNWMVKSGCGVGAAQLNDAETVGVDGVIIEWTDVGNTTHEIGGKVRQMLDAGIPIVMTSRCYTGSVEPVCGTPGGGRTVADEGVVYAGRSPRTQGPDQAPCAVRGMRPDSRRK